VHALLRKAEEAKEEDEEEEAKEREEAGEAASLLNSRGRPRISGRSPPV
jgi:hypothetical protein